MKSYYVILVPIFICFFSCTNKYEYESAEKIHLKDFGTPIYLQGKTVEFDEPLLKPRWLLLKDSILLTHNLNTEYLIHRYNINTRKKIGESISFGSGPEEILWLCRIKRKDSSVWLMDSQKNKFFEYHVDDLFYNDSPQTINKISIEESFSDAVILPDLRIITKGFHPDQKRFTYYDSKGNNIGSKGDFPFYGPKFTYLENVDAFTSQLIIDYDKERIYLFYYTTDLIEVFNYEGELIKRVHGPDHFFPYAKEIDLGEGMKRVTTISEESRDAYMSPLIVNDKIFVLYSGEYYDRTKMELKDKILVFNKNMDPEHIYILSEKIFEIAVDENKRIIYGLTNIPEFGLLEFSY